MPNPSSFVSRLLAAAVGLFIAAYLLVMAVQMLQQIWPWLLGLFIIGSLLGGSIATLRSRHRRW